MKTGEIAWRHLLEKSSSGHVDDMVVVEGNVVIIQAGGEFIRSFSTSMGTLSWEMNDPSSVPGQRGQLELMDSDDEKLIISLSGSGLHCLDTVGRQQWSKPLANSDTVKYQYLRVRDDTITALGIMANSHVVAVSLSADGTVLSQNTIPAAWITDQTKCYFAGENFVCVDGQSGILQHFSLSKPEGFHTTLLQDVGLTCAEPRLSVYEDSLGEFVVTCPRDGSVMLKPGDNAIKLVKNMPGVNSVLVFKYGNSRAFVTFQRSSTSQDCEFRGYDMESGLELPELMQIVPIPLHHGKPEQMFGLIKKKEGSPTVRVLVLSEDESLALFQNGAYHQSSLGRLLWVREEALSKVISVEMVDLPVSPILAKMEDEFSSDKEISASSVAAMFARRFTTQFAQLQDFVAQLKTRLKLDKPHHDDAETYTDGAVDGSAESDMADDYLYRDTFNLKKIIILMTDVGKLYGLYSQTGRVLWRHFLPDIVPFEVTGKRVLPIFLQRSTSHFPHDPLCLLVGKDKLSGRGVLFSFHPVSGQPSEDIPSSGRLLDYKIKQIMMLSQMDEHYLHPVLVMDGEHKFHIYPESCKQMVVDLAPSIFMFTSDSNTAQLDGYALGVADNKELIAKPTWHLNLAVEGETITNILGKRPNEHVHSQGIVLADRSVLYKYLNPNLVVITTEGLDKDKKGFLNVYLLDVVSGQLVFHCNHKKVKGPIHLVHSENWIVYYFWNQRHRRPEISVLEMYEGKKQSNATAFSSLHPPPLPMVLRQSYIFSSHVNSMQATLTEKGITSKHVLLALEFGGILEMPKALLDPRRPEVPTPEHREEAIIPYIPELPRQTEAIINYNRSVANVRGLYLAPAGLESHSMVLAYGLDLFYTRVTPSKMFDVLKEDFDYFFIGSVTLGMIIVSLITKKLASHKALKRAWK